MSITRISKLKFDKFNPQRTAEVQLVTEERDWFSAPGGNVIGAVLMDKIDSDWSYVVLGHDERGKYRCIDLGVSHSTQEEAESELRTKMLGYAESGQIEFPQGD